MKKMKKNILFKFLGFFAIFFAIILGGFANANFEVTPLSFSYNLNENQNIIGTFKINNTGNESINITIIKTNLVDSSKTIILNLAETNITNLQNGSFKEINFSFNSGIQIANYAAKITILDTNNNSLNKTIDIKANVSEELFSDIEIENRGSIIQYNAELGTTFRNILTFKNIGDADIENIRLEITDLDSLRDDIRRGNIYFSSNDFDLFVNERRNIELEIRVPSNIDIDTYTGILSAKLENGKIFQWEIRLTTYGENFEVIIENNREDVFGKVLSFTGETGELIRNKNFRVRNDGDINVNNLQIQMDGDLRSEFGSDIIPRSSIIFSPQSFDLSRGNYQNVGVRISIPQGIRNGNYFGRIYLVGSDGERLDSIVLQVKVTGDVYFSSVTYPDSIKPGETLNVLVKINNRGTKLYQNVKLTGTIFDINRNNDDLVESTSNFFIEMFKTEEKTLRFRIPNDALDNGHILQLRLNYDGEEFTEIFQIKVNRPEHKINIESFSINPFYAKCDDIVLSSVSFKNIGINEETIVVSSDILGTEIIQSASSFKLDMDESASRSLRLDISSLDAGTYNIRHRVAYGSFFELRESILVIQECDENGGGIIIDPIPTDDNETIDPNDSSDEELIFNMTPLRFYVLSAIGITIIIIVISLFFL